jgi:nitrogen fixation NifU-like protein
MTPRNVGDMSNADAEGKVGDPNCGDSLTIYIKVNNNIISDVRYLVIGCVAAIATSSMST